jgi:hypothetical protein
MAIAAHRAACQINVETKPESVSSSGTVHRDVYVITFRLTLSTARILFLPLKATAPCCHMPLPSAPSSCGVAVRCGTPSRALIDMRCLTLPAASHSQRVAVRGHHVARSHRASQRDDVLFLPLKASLRLVPSLCRGCRSDDVARSRRSSILALTATALCCPALSLRSGPSVCVRPFVDTARTITFAIADENVMFNRSVVRHSSTSVTLQV